MRPASILQMVREQKNLDWKRQIVTVAREEEIGLGPEEQSRRVAGDHPRLRSDLGL